MDYKNRKYFIRMFYKLDGNRINLSDFFNVSPSTIDYWRMKHNIKKKFGAKLHKNFVNELYNLVGCEYSLLSFYKNSKTYIKLKHNKCGYIYKVMPGDFLSGRRCPRCNKNHKKTTSQFKKEIHDLEGNEYELLSKYINYDTKVKIKHTKCNNVYKVTPGMFLSGNRCPKCSAKKVGNKLRKTNKKFSKEVYNLVGNEYLFLDNYKKSNIKILCKHNIPKCGYEWELTPSSFLYNGTRCPKCQHQSYKKTHKEFVQEVKQKAKGKYVVLSKYINAKTHVKLKHSKCGNEWYVLPGNFLSQNNRCPKCKNQSKGERKIEEVLKKLNIKYKKEYTFNNCVSLRNRLLRFDFAIFDKNDNLYCLLEYDGVFHYKIIKNMNSKNDLINQQKNDEIKNKYCKNNKITLLRIPYWEYKNTEKILKEFFENF